jgi:hypothetical protein
VFAETVFACRKETSAELPTEACRKAIDQSPELSLYLAEAWHLAGKRASHRRAGVLLLVSDTPTLQTCGFQNSEAFWSVVGVITKLRGDRG